MAEEILVTPQYLKAKEQEWSALIKKAQRDFVKAAEQAEALRKDFDGGPVKKLVRNFQVQKEEGISSFKRFENHIGKLGAIADIYEQAERNNVNVTTEN